MTAPIVSFIASCVRCGPLLLALAMPSFAQDAGQDAAKAAPELAMIMDAGQHELTEYLWLKRPIIIFTDSPADPRYGDQIEMLLADPEPLIERDVVILTDTDPSANTPLRRTLRPRGFVLVLVGKDGMVKLRKPTPWTVRELSRAIDKMPLRIEEIQSRRDNRS